MASNLRVDTILPSSGTTLGIGTAGGTINFLGNSNLTTSGDVTIGGNLGVGGTITYEDVARVDATGISTFREGYQVGPLTGIALTAYKDGSIRTTGIITASSFGSDTNSIFTTGGTERFRINSSGNVSIGNNPTVHSDTLLHVEKSGETNVVFEGDTSTLGARLTLKNNNTGAGALNQIDFADAGGQSTSSIKGFNTDQTNNYGELAFFTRSAQGSPPTERVRITSAGDVNITGVTTATAFVPTEGQLSHRNLVINGSMQINQRGSTAGLTDFNVVTGTLYTLDRWEGVGSSSFDWDSARIKQVSDSPDEFSNSLRVDIGNTETPSGGQNGLVRTKLEAQDLQHLAYGTSSAKTCTLSFWVRSNKTGTYCCQIQHRDDDKYLLYEYAISSANTWEKKTITFAGNTSGAITNDNGTGLVLDFHLACGPDDHVAATSSWTANNSGKLQATSNQVNLWDNTANVWYLTGVQLEVGSVATPFEHKKFQDELYNCQRYYQQIGKTGQDGDFCIGASHLTSNGDQTRVGYFGQNQLRATPTITEFGNGLKVIGGQGKSYTDCTAITDINVTFPSAYLQFNAECADIGDNFEIVVVTNYPNSGIKIEAEL